MPPLITTNPPGTFPILLLPLELRELIYSHILFPTPQCTIISLDRPTSRLRISDTLYDLPTATHPTHTHAFPLLLLSKQVHDESLRLLYSTTKFRLRQGSQTVFLSRIGETNRNLIKSLVVEWDVPRAVEEGCRLSDMFGVFSGMEKLKRVIVRLFRQDVVKLECMVSHAARVGMRVRVEFVTGGKIIDAYEGVESGSSTGEGKLLVLRMRRNTKCYFEYERSPGKHIVGCDGDCKRFLDEVVWSGDPFSLAELDSNVRKLYQG